MAKIEVCETEPIVQEHEIKIECGPSSNQKIKIDRMNQKFKKMKELINEINQSLDRINSSVAEALLTEPIKRNEIEDLSKNPIANSSEKDESSEKINFTEEDLEVMKGMTPDQRKYIERLLGDITTYERALPKIKELIEENGKRLENPIWSLKIGPQ